MVWISIACISTSNGRDSKLATTCGTLGYSDSVCWWDLETSISLYTWSFADNQERYVMPLMTLYLRSITFLSWTMLVMHGANALKPCTICYVPRDTLHQLDVKHPQHTKLESCQITQKAQTMGRGPAEDLLQSYGLCAHKVCVYK